MKSRKDFWKLILIYTLSFMVIVGVIVAIFISYQKGFAWINDGVYQHLITLKYFRSVLLDFFKTGMFRTFTWRIGSGMDMYGNLAYYILGDFLSYFSVFVPVNKLYLFYYVLIFVRMYLIGLAFIIYCRYKGFNRYPTLIGALMYTFCGFVLYAGVRHPYFSNAVMLFPLLMMGIEKIILDDKKVFYVFIVFLMCVCNFYFAYVLFILIAGYGLILTIKKYHSFKAICFSLLKTLGYSILGILLSAIVLLPCCYAFFNSGRVGGLTIYPYSSVYYQTFLSSFITSPGYNWRRIDVQFLVLLSLPYIIKYRKKYGSLLLFLLIVFIPLLFSKVSSMLMGFSYPNNRYSFVVAFMFSLFTTIFLGNKILDDDKKYISIFLLVYFLLIFGSNIGISRLLWLEMILAFISLYILIHFKKWKLGVYLTVMIGIVYTCFTFYDVSYNNYVSQFVDFNGVNEYYHTNSNENMDLEDALEYIRSKNSMGGGYYNIYLTNTSSENLSLMRNYNSLNFYYSISPKEMIMLGEELKNKTISPTVPFKYFDNRTRILTLLNNRYIILKEEAMVPYGYEKLDYDGESLVYGNKYAIPFITFYDTYISESDYASYNPVYKETSLVKGCVLSDDDLNKYNLSSTSLDLSKEVYDLKYKSSLKENKFISKDGNSFTLDVSSLKDSEIYLYIEGLNYEPFSKEDMIDFESDGLYAPNDIAVVKKKYRDYEPTYDYIMRVKYGDTTFASSVYDERSNPYYIDKSTSLINLGYYDKFQGKLTISFTKEGIYTFDKIQVMGTKMNPYKKDVSNLKRSNFKMKKYKNNYLEGSVNVSKDGILQFATMYSKGWDIYVDGEKVVPLKLSHAFLGTYVTKGKHNVVIKYHIPYLKEGIIVSLVTLMVIIIFALVKNIIPKFKIAKIEKEV